MAAQVKEVQAFKAIDGEVFDTYIKAHHRNIWVLLGRLIGEDPFFEDSSQPIKKAKELLHARITSSDRVTSGAAKQAILDLAKELE